MNVFTAHRALAAILWMALAASAWPAPELQLDVPEGDARPGKPYVVRCHVSWDGPPEAWAVFAPELDSPEWAEFRVGAARSRVEDGRQTVVFDVAVIARETGEFELPELRVPYLDRAERAARGDAPPAEDGEKGAGEPPLPKLTALAGTVTVRPDRAWLWWAFAGGAALLAVGATYLLRRRRPAPASGPADGAPDIASVQEAFHGARRKRLDGDYYGFYQHLRAAAEQLSAAGHDNGLVETLSARARDAGYRGTRPSDDELDADFRAVERAWKQCREERNA